VADRDRRMSGRTNDIDLVLCDQTDASGAAGDFLFVFGVWGEILYQSGLHWPLSGEATHVVCSWHTV